MSTASSLNDRDAALPTPFSRRPWSGAKRQAAQALWAWYRAVPRIVSERFDPEVAMDWCTSAAELVGQEEQPDFLPDELWETVDQACERFDLSYELLADQMAVSHLYAGSIRITDSAAFDDYIEQHPFAHARLLAQLGEVDFSWQQGALRNLAQAFFLTNHLANLPRDLERDYLFLPLDRIRSAGASVEALERGELNQSVQNALWKFLVQAKDAYAQSLPLLKDLPWSFRGPFKRAWLGGLEVLRMIERYDYDVWTHEIEFSLWQRAQVFFQALAGRTTFRSR